MYGSAPAARRSSNSAAMAATTAARFSSSAALTLWNTTWTPVAAMRLAHRVGGRDGAPQVQVDADDVEPGPRPGLADGGPEPAAGARAPAPSARDRPFPSVIWFSASWRVLESRCRDRTASAGPPAAECRADARRGAEGVVSRRSAKVQGMVSSLLGVEKGLLAGVIDDTHDEPIGVAGGHLDPRPRVRIRGQRLARGAVHAGPGCPRAWT